jgi:DNA-binding NarL/FixJ family response regulator
MERRDDPAANHPPRLASFVAMEAVTRVLVLDDHPVFATSLARTLGDEPDIDVVATANGIADGLRSIDLGVDVVLCDFRLGDGNGVDFTVAALQKRPELKIVMLTASNDEAILAAALEAGCSGFVTKAEPLESVIGAVRGAVVGEAIITPSLLARLLPRLSPKPRSRNPDLTDREREVLAHVARGLSNQEIASELTIAIDTARNHVRSILSKLSVHSKLQAAAVAVQRGLVRPPEE